MARILIIDDDQQLLRMMTGNLSTARYDSMQAENLKTAIKSLNDSPFDLIVINMGWGEAQTEQILKAASEYNRTVLLIYSGEKIQLAPEVLQKGVFHFLRYPFNESDFLAKVENALDEQMLVKEVDYLRHEQKFIYSFDEIIGESPKLKKIFEMLKKISRSSTTVVITGETGTGKEIIAGAIHFNGPRRNNSFVTVNCAALPETLLESELFGHEKGTFTGAHKLRIGRCEQADKGTLFLDEIAEMSPMTQAKMLRFLQEHAIERLGGSKTIKVDVQIIAATNKDLWQEVKECRFRDDLFYRLNVVHIHLPPLRERKEDIPLLADFFLNKYRRSLNKDIKGFHKKAMELLMGFYWPGNIRELENIIERAVLMCDNDIIYADDILYIEHRPDTAGTPNMTLPPEGVSLEDVEKSLIMQALERSGWVQKEAAALLGLSRRVIQYKIVKYNIKNPRWPKNR